MILCVARGLQEKSLETYGEPGSTSHERVFRRYFEHRGLPIRTYSRKVSKTEVEVLMRALTAEFSNKRLFAWLYGAVIQESADL